MKLIGLFSAISLVVAMSACGGATKPSVAAAKAPANVSTQSLSKDSAQVIAASGLTAVELTRAMGTGWNLGNSLDAIGGETAWGNPRVTQQLINSVKAAGFNTIRIPVAWSQFSDANNFVIKAAWISRVEEVVNYALNADMYVVLNMHWDGGWMQPTYAKQAYVNKRLNIMWAQIATHFQHYDERLLLAGTNEIMVEGDYGTPTAEYVAVQNSFNQTFVDTVRATGGKNLNRYLVVQGFNTNIGHTLSFAKIPADKVNNKLMMEVHYYDPYNFTLNAKSNITQWGKNAADASKVEAWANEDFVDAQFQKMKTHFVDKGVGVILGEFGVMARTNIPDNENYRVNWNQYISKSARAHQMVPIYWDNGAKGNGTMAVFDRNTGNQIYPDIIKALTSAQ